MSEPKNVGSEDSIEDDTPLLPACEIIHLSAAEWRVLQDHSSSRKPYSLLTVGPKGRGDHMLKTQAIDAQSETGKAVTEVSLESVKAPKSLHESVYRVLLNGRAELTATLGELFNSLVGPGFFYMI